MKRDLSIQINWFVDFARVNLDNAEMGQLSKLRTELAQVFLCGRPERLPGPLDESQYRELVWGIEQNFFGTKEKLKNLQRIIISTIDNISDGLKRISKQAEFDWMPYEEAQTFSGVDLISSKIHLDFEVKTLVRPSIEYRHEADTIKIRWAKEWRTQSSFQVLTIPEGHPQNILLYRFFSLLEALPLTAFRRCDSCNKIFFHLSKRNKTYCSNLCAAKAGNRKRRQAIKAEAPALHEQQRKRASERAQKSYERKVRKKHPKAMIQRRKSTKMG